MFLETVTGKLVDIENPDPSTICIEDIAWGLSRISRFCGHTITVVPYNVAQHSIFVANEVESMLVEKYGVDQVSSTGKVVILKALLHDAAEVYTGDLPSPLKQLPKLRPIIKQIEAKLMTAVYAALDLNEDTEDEAKIIKDADRIAQKIEAHAFMTSRGKNWPGLPEVSLERLQSFPAPMPPLEAYKMFLQRYYDLRD